MICLAGILEKIAWDMERVRNDKSGRSAKKRQQDDEEEERGKAIRHLAMAGMVESSSSDILEDANQEEMLGRNLQWRQANEWRARRRLRRNMDSGLVSSSLSGHHKISRARSRILCASTLFPQLIPRLATSGSGLGMEVGTGSKPVLPLAQLPGLFHEITEARFEKQKEISESILQELVNIHSTLRENGKMYENFISELKKKL